VDEFTDNVEWNLLRNTSAVVTYDAPVKPFCALNGKKKLKK
jgi:hypothetical protein